MNDPKSQPIDDRLVAAWSTVDAELRKCIDELTLRIWLAPDGESLLHLHSLIGGVWRATCQPYGRHGIADRFGRILTACAGCPVKVIVCDGSDAQV